MKTLKLKFSMIILLALTCIIAVSAALGLIYANADRNVTISGSSIFYSSGGAEVWAHQETNISGDNEYYAMFVMDSASESVSYRKNLALHWYENAGTEDTEATPVASEKYFNIEIGFESISFDKFIITLQTQQYAKSNSDSVTTSYIIFAPVENSDELYYIVTDDIDAEVTQADSHKISSDHIYISLAEGTVGGSYYVWVANTEATSTTDYTGCDELANIGGTYSKYSSSSTTPCIPLKFTAEFDTVTTKSARMVLYSMNGQSFQYNESSVSLSDDETYYTSGTVVDDVAPVLCLDGGFKYLEAGEEIDLDYTIIDVLGSSTSSTIGYYILNNSQVSATSYNYEDYLSDTLFRTVKTSDDQYMILHSDSYIPAAGDYDSTVFDAVDCDEDNYQSYLRVVGAVKVYVKITDSSASESTYVMLDWYVDDSYLITPSGSTGFIALAEDTRGASYFYTDSSSKTSSPDSKTATNTELAERWEAMVEAYQQLVTEAAEGLKAGSDNYFYLPSMSNITYTYNGTTYTDSMFSDNCDEYSDLTFVVYYMTESSSENSTSGTSDSLSITLSTSGRYRFTIYATDSQDNDMFYYDDDGELVTFEGSEVWSMREAEEGTDYEGTDKYLSWFDFEVEYSEFTISNAGDQDVAYVGASYSIDSDAFEVNGIDYDLSYKLYYFDYDKYYEETGKQISYDELYDLMLELGRDFKLTYNEYLVRIMSTSESEEINYSTFEDYEWDSSGLSFVPQDENGFYLVECTMTSTTYTNAEARYGYMAILASVAPDSIAGENTWVQDNLTSVILLSIAGAALIGIIVLLVIKPKDEDVDAAVIDSNETGKKKNKKQKKSK